MNRSRARWHADLDPFTTAGNVADIEGAFVDIARRYAEPQRHYHTMAHVDAVCRGVDELLDDTIEPDDRAAILLAAWLHDVIYDPTRHDNEAASSRYAIDVLTRLAIPATIVTEAARLIELTAGHAVEPADRHGQVLVDADLAILGAPWPVYAAYARHVRLEYGHVPDEVFLPGRAAVLESFATRPRLFQTDAFHDRFDQIARANLRREIDELQPAAGPGNES